MFVTHLTASVAFINFCVFSKINWMYNYSINLWSAKIFVVFNLFYAWIHKTKSNSETHRCNPVVILAHTILTREDFLLCPLPTTPGKQNHSYFRHHNSFKLQHEAIISPDCIVDTFQCVHFLCMDAHVSANLFSSHKYLSYRYWFMESFLSSILSS